MEDKIKKLLKIYNRLFQLVDESGGATDEDGLAELVCLALLGIISSNNPYMVNTSC